MTHKLFDPFIFTKGSIGFDDMLKRLADFSETLPKITGYPPYDIKKTGDNTYVIEMAVAGFGKQDIELILEEDVLTIKGKLSSDSDDKPDAYLYKGIAERAFTRKFTLADTVQVKNSVLANGMLKILLERMIPEEKKARKIEIE